MFSVRVSPTQQEDLEARVRREFYAGLSCGFISANSAAPVLPSSSSSDKRDSGRLHSASRTPWYLDEGGSCAHESKSGSDSDQDGAGAGQNNEG